MTQTHETPRAGLNAGGKKTSQLPSEYTIRELYQLLDGLKVPLWPASQRGGSREFAFPAWKGFTHDTNHTRLAALDHADAVCGTTCSAWAAVDVDTKNGADIDAVASWLDGLGVKPWARIDTPSGGAHFYINPHGKQGNFPSTSSAWSRIGLEGVEVFAGNHFMFLPGTRRPKYAGRGYRIAWIKPDQINEDASQLFDELQRAKHDGDAFTVGQPSQPSRVADTSNPAWTQAMLDGCITELASCPRGGRNAKLNDTALRLGHYIPGGHLERSTVEQALMDACQTNGLISDDGISAVRATIGSGLNTGMAEPMEPPSPQQALTFTPGQPREKASQQTSSEAATVSNILAERTFTAQWLDSQQFPELQWAIPNLVAEGIGLLTAPPKAGKSWLVLNLALAVASGGRALGCINVAPRPVLYCALEDGARRLQYRCRHLMGDESLPEGLMFMTQRPTDMMEATTLLNQWCNEHRAGLVIVDTLAAIREAPKGRQSEYQADYDTMSQLKRITDTHEGTSMLVVHHTRKMTSTDWADSTSGTNGLNGGVDFVLNLARPRGEASSLLNLTGRDVPEGSYALTMKNGAWSLEGDDLKAAGLAALSLQTTGGLGERSRDLIEAVAAHPEGVSTKQLAEDLGWSKADVSKYAGRAVEQGRIVKLSRGRWAPTGNGVDTVDTMPTSKSLNNTAVTTDVDRVDTVDTSYDTLPGTQEVDTSHVRNTVNTVNSVNSLPGRQSEGVTPPEQNPHGMPHDPDACSACGDSLTRTPGLLSRCHDWHAEAQQNINHS